MQLARAIDNSLHDNVRKKPQYLFVRDLDQDDFKGDLGQGDSKVENVHTDKGPVCAGDAILKGWAFRPNGLCPQFNPNNIYLGRGESLSGSGITASFNVLPNGEIHIWAWIYIPTATGVVGEEWKSGNIFMAFQDTNQPISDRMYTNGVFVSPSDEKAGPSSQDGPTGLPVVSTIAHLRKENERFRLQQARLRKENERFRLQQARLRKENERFSLQQERLCEENERFSLQQERLCEENERFSLQQERLCEENKALSEENKALREKIKTLCEKQTPVRVKVFRPSN
jgi:hypothetical protein